MMMDRRDELVAESEVSQPLEGEVIEGGTDLVLAADQTPVMMFADSKQRTNLYAHIEREIEAFQPDITTAKGRQAIKSFARKIVRTKTTIDGAGKKLNEDARALIDVVDAARRDVRNTLDIYAEKARKPLTDWEDAEEKRFDECKAVIAGIWNAAIVTLDDTAATVRQRGSEVYGIVLDPERFGDMLEEAQSAKEHVIGTLRADLVRLVQAEADAAELTKLKAEKEEREARETAEREAREQQEREAEEGRQAEEARKAAEQAERDKIAQAERDAAERAKREAEEIAAAALAEERRVAEEALAAERKRAEQAEADAKAEREKAEAARVAEESRLAAEKRRQDEERAETERRENNKRHRAKVMGEAKEAIISCGVDEEAARKIVLAIVGQTIPHVTLSF